MVKTDADGNIEWKRIIIAPFMSLLLYDVKQADDGGFMITGYASYEGLPGRSAGTPGGEADGITVIISYLDAIAIKTDSKGRTGFMQLYLFSLIRCLAYWGIYPSMSLPV